MTRRIVAGAVALAAIVFMLALFQPFKGDGGEPVRVSIPKQAGVGEIADILADRDVISNATREVIATVPVYRRDPRTLVVSGHPRLVGARSYFWYSDYHVDGSADCGSSDGFPVTCQDDVPERGWIRLDHPGWPASAGQRLR